MRIGVLTAGGDCPGLNAVIRSVVHRAVDNYGDEVIGFEDGYAGLLERRYRALDLNAVSGILARGGTILGSSRLERDRLRNVQLPQKFALADLRKGHEFAASQGRTYTEDATLVAEAGATVHFVDGADSNIKVTTPTDIHLAVSLLHGRDDDD